MDLSEDFVICLFRQVVLKPPYQNIPLNCNWGYHNLSKCLFLFSNKCSSIPLFNMFYVKKILLYDYIILTKAYYVHSQMSAEKILGASTAFIYIQKYMLQAELYIFKLKVYSFHQKSILRADNQALIYSAINKNCNQVRGIVHTFGHKS